MALTKPNTGDPGYSGATKASTLVGAVVDWINQNVYNVKEAAYGAVGNGTTDDAAAINSAISAASAAGGGTVWFPAATYAIKSTLNLASNVQLKGAGPLATTIKAVATYSGSTMMTAGSGISYSTIADMTIDANSLVATAVVVGAGGTNAGHNLITRCQVKGATTAGIDVGNTVSGSESHVIRNDITGCPTSIISGPDNEIAFNNMGSFSSYGIDLAGGGCAVIGNHPVANTAGSVCLRQTSGQITQIIGNYFDHGGITLDAPMVLIASGSAKTIRGLIIQGNVFLAPTITTDNTYPAMRLDMTTGTISMVDISGNTGVGQDSTHRFSAVLDGVGSPTDVSYQSGAFYFVTEPYTGFTPSTMRHGLFNDGTSTKTSAERRNYQAITISGSGTTTMNARQNLRYRFDVTTASAFTLTTSNAATGMELKVGIKNSSGGAMGAITWTGFTMPAFTNPANGKVRWISFTYDGTNWIEDFRSAADI